jgi:hypothetical protein
MIEAILHFFGLCPDHGTHANLMDLLRMFPFIGGGLAAVWCWTRSRFKSCKCCNHVPVKAGSNESETHKSN